MKARMECPKATTKILCSLSDELAVEICRGKCSVSALIMLYKLMTKLGIGVAFHRLGFYYLAGVLDGYSVHGPKQERRRRNFDVPLRYLRRAYELGVKESAHDIAHIYFQKAFKYTVRQNVKAPAKILDEMLRWTKLALTCEHGRRRGNMYHNLAWYEWHYGDSHAAISLWRKAARNGGVDAMLELAIVYGYGEVVKRNLRLSRHYFNKCLNKCVGCEEDYLLERNARKEMHRLGLVE